MANRYHGNVPGQKLSGGEGGSNKAQGRAPESFSKEGTAAWPGLPGKAQSKSRANGIPTRGKLGPFYHKKEGI